MIALRSMNLLNNSNGLQRHQCSSSSRLRHWIRDDDSTSNEEGEVDDDDGRRGAEEEEEDDSGDFEDYAEAGAAEKEQDKVGEEGRKT